MLFRRDLAPMLFALSVIAIGGGSTPAAQPSAGGTNLVVPITGVADAGGTFRGTMLIEQFAAQANGVAAVGTVTGALTANGTARNLVMPVTLPLDIAASRARLSTDPALAQGSCDVLHVELGAASINVLGFTIGLTPAAFDIASAIQAGATPAGARYCRATRCDRGPTGNCYRFTVHEHDSTGGHGSAAAAARYAAVLG